MHKILLNHRWINYKNLSLLILIISFCLCIYYAVNKKIADTLFWLGMTLYVLRLVVIPMDFTQNIAAVDYTKNFDENNRWHRWVMLGEKFAFLIFTVGIAYSIFLQLKL
ncbi:MULTISPECIES: hypothetical protein [unclassified Psychrobacter]|uniref:hypothetical protein n=1 Tax=unclassified Psychrobacter TaxID=196806 RepID=UPI001EDEB65C|nr:MULTISPECIES: hypothetical protein [unclassified Psychrobacter]MCG3810473.1 hypothetical protein [Psychrobacter sp. Ps4]